MNHKLKRKWVNALRGGNYEQGIGDHRDSNPCALRVLSDILGLSIPGHILDYKKLGQHVGISVIEIYSRNDGIGCHQHSFQEMADWIEENL